MTQKLSYYQDLVRDLVARDRNLRALQYRYEAISQLQSTLPEPLNSLEYIVPFKSAVPFTALKGGTRALSQLDERLSIHPISVYLADTEEQTKEQVANNWETVLKWELARATRRQPGFRESVIWNALVYDEIAAQVVHIPTQIKSLKSIGGSTNRHEAALRHGNFAIILADPKTLHPVHSDYMLESETCVKVMTAQAIVSFWGKYAKVIAKRIKDDPSHALRPYLIVDHMSLDDRVVWAMEGNDETMIGAGAGDEILAPTPNPHPFINWAHVIGGVNTESSPEHRRKPLLYPVVQAEQWFIANVAGTLGLSQAISEANAPIHEVRGTAGRNVVIDHTMPGGIIYTSPQQIYQRLQRGDISPGIERMLNKYEADMNRSTLPSILVTAEPAAGETYSGYQLRVQTAIGALLPFKGRGENLYDDIFRLMLLHCHYEGVPLSGYKDADNRYFIMPDEIDPNVIELKTELTPDVPVERYQRIQSALALIERGNYSPIRAYEMLGETDPQGALEEWIQWKFVEAKVEARAQSIMMMESGQMQQVAQAMAGQMAQQQERPFGGQMTEETTPGGMSTVQAMGDEATFEGATGETRGMA